jgi:hypothetical protein
MLPSRDGRLIVAAVIAYATGSGLYLAGGMVFFLRGIHLSEPIPTWLGSVNLQCVDRLGDRSRAPGAWTSLQDATRHGFYQDRRIP